MEKIAKQRVNIKIPLNIYSLLKNVIDKHNIDISEYIECLVIDELFEIDIARNKVSEKFNNMQFERSIYFDIHDYEGEYTKINFYLPNNILELLKESANSRTQYNIEHNNKTKISFTLLILFCLCKDLLVEDVSKHYRMIKDNLYLKYLTDEMILELPRIRINECQITS